MVSWNDYSYVPVIRTRDAELKGLREVDRSQLRAVLPLLEFTRSRRSKSNPTASVDVSVAKAAEILGNAFFIADVTSLDSQTNTDITRLLDEQGSFENWVTFVRESLGKKAIPVVHLTEPFDEVGFRTQVLELIKSQSAVALRLPTSYSSAAAVLASAASMLKSNQFCVLIDAGYVKSNSLSGAQSAIHRVSALASSVSPGAIISVASSFPSSVVADGYGEDAVGEFALIEVLLSERLIAAYPFDRVIHGDYACIHPLDFEGTVTAWVPRVDVPLDRSVFYHRYRRPAGGYVTAAQNALKDARYIKMDCWAHENIVEAAAGSPRGRSPSHWISVRVNYHIQRQISRVTV